MPSKGKRHPYSYDAQRAEQNVRERLYRGFFGLCYRASQGEIEPLCAYLEADKPLTAEDKQNLAWLLRTVHLYGMPRKKGRRSPTIIVDKVQRAGRFGARIVDRERDQWLAKNPGRERLPKRLLDDLIKLAIKRTEAKYPALSRYQLELAIRTARKRPPEKR